MKFVSFLIPGLALCASCDALPRDMEGTRDRVVSERRFKLGIIASGALPPSAQIDTFVQGVAAETGARPQKETAAAELLLARLEAGEVDIVIGPMSIDSPWSSTVTFLPPLGGAEGSKHAIIPMARHGENAWITLLDAQARELSRK